MDLPLPIKGTCQCTSCTFTISTPPSRIYICHCLDCQHQSSSAFGCSLRFAIPSRPSSSPAPILDDPLSYLPPTWFPPGPYAVYAKTPASGKTRFCYFCSKCGSRIAHITPGSEAMSVKAGCVEGIDWNKVWNEATHIWTKRTTLVLPDHVRKWDEEPGDDK